MRTDRVSLRALLASVLAGSALLFFVGIQLERRATASPDPAVVLPSAAASAAPVEESGGEAAEAGHPAAEAGQPAAEAAPPAAEGTAETANEHAAESWPLGIDLEAPLLVGGVILVSLGLAVGALVTMSPLVPMAIFGFAILFGLFDLLEAAHQIGRGRNGLAAIALVLLVAHAAAGLIALRLLAKRDPAERLAA